MLTDKVLPGILCIHSICVALKVHVRSSLLKSTAVFVVTLSRILYLQKIGHMVEEAIVLSMIIKIFLNYFYFLISNVFF